ncbi:hypothetical protein SAMD00019534_063620 [Acytostelium subglobosum LB1]|uniref:hypothetical protein n=1 Tax=Acytostelium subglobosum LB1 TaxID=1410327 RepID=UPI000644FE3F|nr:hypothetical protein SAMD00019534_063620 [Acytostelium subglobosum LB1]GAM23187.1 hypothetical protein SAMD00019534_063620 [Acytostelium subglobosum LB1]|eukprot:XP_012753636.1 hypothetical protein SAMD00019534_063620 [Acytostelium subglobosum LB1]
MSHIDNIRDQLERKDYQSLWCTPRLEHLWRTLKHSATSYQRLEKEHKDVSTHFEELFKLLMAQEHKVKSPINAQMSTIQQLINDITDEIMFVYSTRNMTPYTNDHLNKNDECKIEQLSTLIESISKCDSIEQFVDINNNNKTSVARDDWDGDNDESLPPHETQ